MSATPASRSVARHDAVLAAALLAIDPIGLGGATIRARPGPARDRWLGLLKVIAPIDSPLRRIPTGIADDRLLGGLDLAATLARGAPVAERGILAETDGGTAVLSMAERLSPRTVAYLTAVLDTGEVRLARDGISKCSPARLCVIALDEGVGPDEGVSAALADRLAFRLELDGVAPDALLVDPDIVQQADEARVRLARVAQSDELIGAMCAAATALGIASLRAPLFALHAARAIAALDGRTSVDEQDAACAARLVLAHRATQIPTSSQPGEEEEETADEGEGNSEPAPQDRSQGSSDRQEGDEGSDTADETQQAFVDATELTEIAVAAASAALPKELLANLQAKGKDGAVRRSASIGRAGANRQSTLRGRAIGNRAGALRQGARLDVIATLRAAAPWQNLRKAGRAIPEGLIEGAIAPPPVEVRRSDFRIFRFKQRTETATIFLVDASGSAALNRMAEAKGAVELLLADCYVRRDQVALISFGGRGAELLLPPTRSLVRAKRSLTALPGGGGTPLATGLTAAADLALAQRGKGITPVVVILTDGRANIGRTGRTGRPAAEADAMAVAGLIRLEAINAIFIDTSAYPNPFAGDLAQRMAATYVALPNANSHSVSRAVKQATAAA